MRYPDGIGNQVMLFLRSITRRYSHYHSLLFTLCSGLAW